MTVHNMNGNLYSSTFKWAHSQGENYTTDALCYILNTLLIRDKKCAVKFLNQLCFDGVARFAEDEPIEIVTQVRDQLGIADISIRSKTVFAIVEVKIGSGLHGTQLERYAQILKNAVANREAKYTELILLQRYPSADSMKKPGIGMREQLWSDVDRELNALDVQDEVLIFLFSEFTKFLEQEVMTIEKISWQLLEGAPALLALIDMLKTSLKELNIPIHQQSNKWRFPGFYLHEKRYWVGIHMDDPTKIYFQIRKAKPKSDFLVGKGWTVVRKHLTTPLDLVAEDVHFFSLSKESQQQTLMRFVKSALEEAKKGTAR